MQSKNYYCNDEIDRESCVLSYDEENESYKIGKHKVPSLNEIIPDLIGSCPHNSTQRMNFMQKLHSFLLTGKKDVDAKLIAEKDIKAPFASVFNTIITENGYFKEGVSKARIEQLKYTKDVRETEDEPLKNYLQTFLKELEINVGAPYHDETIASLEKFFYSEIEKSSKEASGEIAWFSKFKKVNQFHYHLAKKQTKRENLYFVSQIDIETEDALYYVVIGNRFSIRYITLYLNFQNIDLKKENLYALIIMKNGFVKRVAIQKITDEVMDNAVVALKQGEYMDFSSYYTLIIDDDELRNPFFSVKSYITSLLPKEEAEKSLSFSLCELFSSSVLLKTSDDIQEIKKTIIKMLYNFLIFIKNIYIKHSVEYALIAFLLLKEELRNIENINDIGFLGDKMLFNNFFTDNIESYLKAALQLGKAFKRNEESLAEIGYQEVKYQDVTLQLKLSRNQKDALMHYLKANLITTGSPFFAEALKNEKEGLQLKKNPSIKEINIDQIVNIKERKKLATLNGKSVNLTGLYKKTDSYYGCVKSDKYLECEIIDVKVFRYEGIKITAIPIPIQLAVSVAIKNRCSKFGLIFYLFEEKVKVFEDEQTKKSLSHDIKVANEELTLFFDTFSIKRGQFNIDSWIGKKGTIAIMSDRKDETGNPCFVKAKGKGVLFCTEDDLIL